MKTILTSRPDRTFKVNFWFNTAFVLAAVWLALSQPPQPVLAAPRGTAEHVVIVVWDGLRPDFLTPDHAPTLYRLAHQGTLFSSHHSIYVSSREVNGTALGTGSLPEHSGVFANEEYQPDIRHHKPVGMPKTGATRGNQPRLEN